MRWPVIAVAVLWSACFRPSGALPEVEITGPGAPGVEIDGWTSVRSMGVVVKWTARVTRRAGPAPGPIAYTLLDPTGAALSRGSIQYRSAYDYAEPFLPGSSFTLSVPAYRGESTGNRVARIRIDIGAIAAEPAAAEPVIKLPFDELLEATPEAAQPE